MEKEKTNKETKTKKPVAKKKTTTKVLNETTKVKKEKVVKETIEDNKQECSFCHKLFEKGLTVCPHCRKNQKSGLGIAFFIIVAGVFLTIIVAASIIQNLALNGVTEQEYKEKCSLITYEDLIRTPKKYKGEDIKIIGKVTNVEGFDSGFSNSMIITINANMFNEGNAQNIVLNFDDKEYDSGFMIGDVITAYGEYTQINGNEPTIEVKYINIGQ